MNRRFQSKWVLLTTALLGASLGLGMTTSSQAAGLELQPMRPRAGQLQAPKASGPTVSSPSGQLPVKMHLNCVGWIKGSGWWANDVRLTNDGPSPIPPGTTVYYWYFKDQRYWSSHTFSHGLAQGQSEVAPLATQMTAGASCAVSFHKLDWMQLNAPSHQQFNPGQAKPAPFVQSQDATGYNQHRATYRLSCTENEKSGFQNVLAGGIPSFYLDIANSGPTTVPSGAKITYEINGVESGRQVIATPLRQGQHVSIHVYRGKHGKTNSCTAHVSN